MKYYRKFLDVSRKFRYISDSEDFRGFHELDFTVGKYIEKWDNLAWIRNNDDKCNGDPEDVLQNHLLLPIFSGKMRDVLRENCINGIQYLPIKVFKINGDQIFDYDIANILNVVPALDLNKSGYYIIPNDHINVMQRGKIGAIHKFVLDRSRIGDFDIFRLHEHTSDIIFSEKFVNIFKKNKLTGWVFKEVELS